MAPTGPVEYVCRGMDFVILPAKQSSSIISKQIVEAIRICWRRRVESPNFWLLRPPGFAGKREESPNFKSF